MTKIVVIAAVVLVLVMVVAAIAQTAAHKTASATRPNTTAPTKVTGDGVKTPSGLQYWEIKVARARPQKTAAT
jgi:hypothetical protein